MCKACELSASQPWRGGYVPAGIVDFGCVACMVRLIRSARPSRKMQEIQIATLARHHGATKWAAMWPDIQALVSADKRR